MEIISIFVGLFMIGIGFLVKSSPGLIAGYNTMSADKKKNVDIDGLSTYMRNSMIIIGLSIIAGYYFFKLTGFDFLADLTVHIVTLAGVLMMAMNAQKFDKNKTNSISAKRTYIILGLIGLFVTGLIAYGYSPSKPSISDKLIKASGMYGFELSVYDIEKVELTNQIPDIKLRTNGFSFGSVKRGFFELDKYGQTHLRIFSDKSPYLIMTKLDSTKMIMNFKNKTETENLFNDIKAWLDSKQ